MWADPAVTAIFTAKTLAVLWLGAFMGGFASGAAGFAFGIVASAVWLHALDPLHTTMLVVSGGLTIQLGTIWPMRREINVARLAPFAIAGPARHSDRYLAAGAHRRAMR